MIATVCLVIGEEAFARRGGSNDVIVNVEVVVANGDKYLLTMRSRNEEVAPGMLSFPGGKVEGFAPETDILEHTVVGELREETGIEVTDINYAASKLFVAPGGQAVVDMIFTASISLEKQWF